MFDAPTPMHKLFLHVVNSARFRGFICAAMHNAAPVVDGTISIGAIVVPEHQVKDVRLRHDGVEGFAGGQRIPRL